MRRNPVAGDEVYSPSRLTSFEDCPRKFQYRYVQRLPVDSESVEAFVGKRVHEVLERLYHFTRRGMVPSLGKVIDRFRSMWSEAWSSDRIRIVREGMQPLDYRANGERCLTNYYRRHYPFDCGETLGIEERVSFSLDEGGGYRVQGVVDRIVRTGDDAIEIHDYKTGQRVPRQQQLDQDRQLALYQIGVALRFRHEGPIRLVWHYLFPDQLRTSSRTPEALASLREETMGLIDRIRAEREFEPRPSALCRWCEFSEICPAGPGRSAATAAAAAVSLEAPDEAAPLANASGQLLLLR